MDQTKHPDRPFRSRFAEPHDSDAHLEWERLLDAGLIGAPRQPKSPEQLANIARVEEIFRGAALYRRQQRSGPYWVAGG